MLALLAAALQQDARADSSTWQPLKPVGEVGVSARVNPLGVATHARLALRYRLVPPSSPLRQGKLGNSIFDPTSVGLLFMNDLNPAFGRVGLGVEVTPLAMWRMRAWYQVIQYFGTFANLMEFSSTHENWSPGAMKRKSRSGCCHHADIGQRAYFENVFQMKLYKLVALSLFTAEAWKVPQAGTYYSGEYDLLVHSPDVVLKHILALAVVVPDGKSLPEVAVGGFHAIARSLRAGSQNQQAGMLLMFAPVNNQWLFFRTGMTTLIGFHLQDPYKHLAPYGVMLLNFTLM